MRGKKRKKEKRITARKRRKEKEKRKKKVPSVCKTEIPTMQTPSCAQESRLFQLPPVEATRTSDKTNSMEDHHRSVCRFALPKGTRKQTLRFICYYYNSPKDRIYGLSLYILLLIRAL